MQNPFVGKLLTQIESSKLTNKRIREQLERINDRETEARLLNVRRNNSNNNSNNNNNSNGGRPGERLDLPLPLPHSSGAHKLTITVL